jgi:hypothetical protein
MINISIVSPSTESAGLALLIFVTPGLTSSRGLKQGLIPDPDQSGFMQIFTFPGIYPYKHQQRKAPPPEFP